MPSSLLQLGSEANRVLDRDDPRACLIQILLISPSGLYPGLRPSSTARVDVYRDECQLHPNLQDAGQYDVNLQRQHAQRQVSKLVKSVVSQTSTSPLIEHMKSYTCFPTTSSLRQRIPEWLEEPPC